jgi:hypothetical protein
MTFTDCKPININGRCMCEVCGRPFSRNVDCARVKRNCYRPAGPSRLHTPEESAARQRARDARKEHEVQELVGAAEKLGISLSDIGHYAAALARWTAAGFPTRSDEETAAIYEQHCRPCPQNVDDRCRKCGCCVSPSKMALRNKIKMATEHCALRKW